MNFSVSCEACSTRTASKETATPRAQIGREKFGVIAQRKTPGNFSRAHPSNLANPIGLKSGQPLAYAFAAALSPFTATLNRDL
jgi:hypothetical protein